jgi:hypothetical protein
LVELVENGEYIMRGNLIDRISKSGGTLTTIEGSGKREKLTLEDYRMNWSDFILTAWDWHKMGRNEKENILESEEGDAEYDYRPTKEILNMVREWNNQHRIRMVRAGITIHLGEDDNKDIVVRSMSEAIDILQILSDAFKDGEMDAEIERWMSIRDANVAKAKLAKEKKKKKKHLSLAVRNKLA